jgi:protoheme ferro-lyase
MNKGNVYPEKQYSNIEDNLDKEVAELFTITLEKLKASGTMVVLLFPPRLQISNFKSTTQYNELKRIAEKFDVPIIDKFYNHKDFINDSTMFKDIGHLNKTGANKFSSLLARELKNIIIDKQ